MKKHSLFDLIAKVLSKNSSAEESCQIDFSAQEFRDLQNVWEWSDRIKAPNPSAESWEKLYQRMQAEESKQATILKLPTPAATPLSRVAYWAVRIAAVLLITTLSFWAVQNYFFGEVVVETKNGERRTTLLPDGSQVELNAATRLQYAKDFQGVRNVDLAGEAFFQVQPGSEPFVVNADGAKVRVLGTSFDVQSRDHTIAVAVASGRVSLANNENREVILQKGEMSRVEMSQPPSAPERVNLDEFLAWREGRLEFLRTPINVVMAELQRQFDVTIKLAHPGLGKVTLTASFHADQSIQEVLTAICLTFDWKFRESKDVFIIENRSD